MIQCCSAHFSASVLYRPPRDLHFYELNFRDLKVNHEIHENIVPREFGAIRYCFLYKAHLPVYAVVHAIIELALIVKRWD